MILTLHTYIHVLTVRNRQLVSGHPYPASVEYRQPLTLAASVIKLVADENNRIIRRNVAGMDAQGGDDTVIAEFVETALSELGEGDLLTGFDIGRSLAAVALAAGHGAITPIAAITRFQWAYANRDVRVTCLGDTPSPVASLYPLTIDMKQPLSLDQITSEDWRVIRALTEEYAGLAMCRCTMRHQPRSSV